MQNYNNPMQPQGGYGAPPPQPPKKGMATGVKVLIAVIAVLIASVTLVVVLAVGGIYWFSRQAREIASVNPAVKSGLGGSSTSSSSSSSTSSASEAPVPTSEQAAAISGGQSAVWEQQEISWTVPQKWKENTAESTSFMWRSPGSWDAASLIVNISPMGADFPADISLKAFYDQAQTRKTNGEVDEVRWISFDGTRGVLFRESAPESADNPQRLQWMGYRKYKGQTQLVNIMLASRGKDFARHEDASLNAFYAGAEQRKRTGEVNEVRWLKLDGQKGVMFRESAPEKDDSPQRLQWMGYRNSKGQKQLVNIMLASRGKDFARHEDALSGILYSTKLGQ